MVKWVNIDVNISKPFHKPWRRLFMIFLSYLYYVKSKKYKSCNRLERLKICIKTFIVLTIELGAVRDVRRLVVTCLLNIVTSRVVALRANLTWSDPSHLANDNESTHLTRHVE